MQGEFGFRTPHGRRTIDVETILWSVGSVIGSGSSALIRLSTSAVAYVEVRAFGIRSRKYTLTPRPELDLLRLRDKVLSLSVERPEQPSQVDRTRFDLA